MRIKEQETSLSLHEHDDDDDDGGGGGGDDDDTFVQHQPTKYEIFLK